MLIAPTEWVWSAPPPGASGEFHGRDDFRFPHLPQRLHHRGHAGGVLRREPGAEISRLRGGAGEGAGQARHHPQGSGHRNRQALPRQRNGHGEAEGSDRAHRLSGAAGGAAARQGVQGQARRMVPLGRHHPGHHRHRHRPADPGSAGAGRERNRRHLRRARDAGEEIPRHADGRALEPAAGGADHLRLQDGDHAGRLPAPQAAA